MKRFPAAYRWLVLTSCLACVGCSATGPTTMPTEEQRVGMLGLMLPQQIKIQPFTKIRSFNNDELPDGILAVVRPLDRFDDPVKAVGFFYFELYALQNASGDNKGERLAYWERPITTAQEVRLYWTRAQMYEFQLAWTGGAPGVAPGRKFVLVATYRTPWDETIRDEYVLEFQLPPGASRPAAAE